MRAVGALSATTEGFLTLYTGQVVAWTLTVPQGTPIWKVIRDFKRLTRRLRHRYPDVHLLWTLASHAPSFHPHVHLLINGHFSTGVMTQLLKGTCFRITFRRPLSRQEYEADSRYDYLAYNLYQTRTSNPEGMRDQRLWGVVAGHNIKAAVRRETRKVELDGPTARLWRQYNGYLLQAIEPQLLSKYRAYLARFYALPEHPDHEAVNVLLLTRPRSPQTGRRPISLAQFRQRLLYQRFQREMPKLKTRSFFAGFAIGFRRAVLALVLFYALLFQCFLT